MPGVVEPPPPEHRPDPAGEAPAEDAPRGEESPPRAGETRPRLHWRPVAGYALVVIALSALAGVIWRSATTLPGYTVASDGSAATTQHGLTQVFSGDAWFCLIGAAVGLILGALAWWWFGRIGWLSVVFATLGALIAAAGCWWIGWELGPGPLNERLVAARPGDFVPIALTVRAPAGLLIWAAAAVLPILIRSSLGPDPDDPKPRRHPRRPA